VERVGPNASPLKSEVRARVRPQLRGGQRRRRRKERREGRQPQQSDAAQNRRCMSVKRLARITLSLARRTNAILPRGTPRAVRLRRIRAVLVSSPSSNVSKQAPPRCTGHVCTHSSWIGSCRPRSWAQCCVSKVAPSELKHAAPRDPLDSVGIFSQNRWASLSRILVRSTLFFLVRHWILHGVLLSSVGTLDRDRRLLQEDELKKRTPLRTVSSYTYIPGAMRLQQLDRSFEYQDGRNFSRLSTRTLPTSDHPRLLCGRTWSQSRRRRSISTFASVRV